MKNHMKILILGGSGFLGKNLVRQLLQSYENTVVSFDRCESTLVHSNLAQIVGEFDCDTDFVSLTYGMDIVVHCISTTSPRNFSGFYPEFQDNVLPTIRLLDACKENSVKKVVYLSSGGTVYGESDENLLSEEHCCNPICAYGVHKLSVEKIAHVYTHLNWVKCDVVRLANPYGPEQVTKGVGVISAFIRKIMEGSPIELIGDSSNLRDYIYIDDAINAIQAVIQYRGEVDLFNIGTGVGTSVNELIRIISEKLQLTPQIIRIPGEGVDVSKNILDISRLKKETGFTPRYTLECGIDKMIAALKANGAN